MIDMIKFCYYPFCENINNDTDCHVVRLKTLTSSHIKRLLKGIHTEPKINGSYIEYGIRDTFVRSISHNTNTADDTRMFFRREIHTTRLENCPGIFTIELYIMCDEANFPILVNYPHHLNCDVDTYVLSNTKSKPLRMCFTKVTDNELHEQNQQKVKSKYSMPDNMMYFSVCRDMTVTNTTNVDVELNAFFKDIMALTNNHKKNFVY